MQLVKFKDGEVRQVTSRHAEILVKNGLAEVILAGESGAEVKEEKTQVETKEEKVVQKSKGKGKKAK